MSYKDEEQRKVKQREISKRWNAKHKEEIKAKRQTPEAKAKQYEAIKRYRQNHPELTQAVYKKHYRKRVDELSDSYIRRLIVQTTPDIESKDIPQELIEVKRAAITLKRLLKKVKHEEKT